MIVLSKKQIVDIMEEKQKIRNNYKQKIKIT